MAPSPETDHPVILFDGVCNLCNRGVRFVIERDPDAEFRFAPIQSDPGAALLEACGLDPGRRDTWVLVVDGECYTRSAAAIRVAARLGGACRFLSPLRYVPRVLRDAVYDFVATHRHAVFGRREECMVPEADVADRFLAGTGRPGTETNAPDRTTGY